MKAIEPPDSLDDLRKLRRPGKGIRTSNGRFYGGNDDVWGRDMAITANDLIDIYPEITKEAILTLSELQGTDYNRKCGEKPGRIHTEYREIYNSKTLGAISKFSLSLVSKFLWRNGWKSYTNYFSSDTTPLYIKTVYNYAQKYPEILDQEVVRKNGERDTVMNCVLKAAEYIESSVDDDGLIQIKEFNLAGNQFRYWRDSPSSYRDENSKLPNIAEEMVILDIQVLAAYALNLVSDLIKYSEPEKSIKWQNLSLKIRDATIKNLWMPEHQYFAYGMDKTKRGHFKQLKTIQSNAAWMLNTNFFDDLSDDLRQKYLTGIIQRLFSPEFITDAGVRCRSKKYIYDRSFQDYHGSWVSWPVENFMLAQGLRRQGFYQLADQIEDRIINSIDISGVNYEFFVVDKDGKVLLNPNKKPWLGSTAVALEMRPEQTIAWTVTASLKIRHDRAERKNQPNTSSPKWINDLENSLLSNIYIFTGELNDDEIDYYLASEPKIYIDRTRGFFQSAQNIAKELGPALLAQIRKNPFKNLRKKF
jgi:glycogen debranching enzyme